VRGSRDERTCETLAQSEEVVEQMVIQIDKNNETLAKSRALVKKINTAIGRGVR
jgi:hypothetical protein